MGLTLPTRFLLCFPFSSLLRQSALRSSSSCMYHFLLPWGPFGQCPPIFVPGAKFPMFFSQFHAACPICSMHCPRPVLISCPFTMPFCDWHQQKITWKFSTSPNQRSSNGSRSGHHPTKKSRPSCKTSWTLSIKLINRELFQRQICKISSESMPRSEAYEFQLLLARQISPSSLEYQNAAINLIVTSIRTPTNFDFDTLLTINSVVATKDHPLFSLLHIFLNDGLEELRAWTSKHGDILSQHSTFQLYFACHTLNICVPDLDASALERKIRLLSLAALGFKNVGQQVSYETIASTIDIPVNQVERWVIDGKNSPSRS